MATQIRTWKLSEVAAAVGGQVRGDPETVVERPVPAGTDDPRGITFAGDRAYLQLALSVPVAAVLVGPEVQEQAVPTVTVPNPREAFGRVLAMMARPLPLAPGTHPTAVVSPEAAVHPSAQIGAYCVVEAGAVVAARVRLYPFCYVGDGCSVGADSVLYPRVTLYQDVVVGQRCIVHSGVVLGADGFGFAWDGKRQQKIPQVGGVVIGDDVELGANTCVDRATAGNTVIGRGTKLDDLVLIAHNVSVGEDTVIAAQVGVAGSSEVGSRVTIGGQAAVSDHVAVGDDIVLGGRSGVITDLKTPGQYMGLPPVPITQAVRALALTQRLPELFQRLRALESKAFKDEPK